MRTAPANWATYLANVNHKKEYQAIISESDGSNPVTYGMASIKAASIESALLASDMWVGNAISSKLSISLANAVTVPRMAKIRLNVRLSLNGLFTDYVPVGAWWVDERPKGSLWVDLTCYDAMLKTEQPFISSTLESGTWPITMTAAVNEICTRIGVTLDSRTTILTGADYVVPYTNDLTMREVLENIAAAHGGNWAITPEGKLRLIPLASATASPAHVLVLSARDFESGDPITISKVSMYDDSDNTFTAGDTTGYELSIDCLYATTAIATALGNASTGTLHGVTYAPFEATQTYLNPLFELGDDVSIGGISSVINKADISLTVAYTADISCPHDQEVDHEYPYLTEIKRQNKRAVKLNNSYYGTTISRANGLVIDKIAGDAVTARAIFNSDKLAMQALKSGVLTDCIYFDPVAGKYIFDGTLSADVISALSAVITPNLYAEKATIAELTVDQLDTSTKVAKYLATDTTDVNYIRAVGQTIQWVTASTTGATAEQAVDRNSAPLYWVDATHKASTTEDTGLPVTVYVYTEQIKSVKEFFSDGSDYVPRDVWGAGTGTGDNDKLIIYKPQDEAIIKYVRDNGEETTIRMSEFVDAKMRRLTSCAINKATGQVSVTMEGESTPVTLTYSETATSMTFTWPDGHTATVAIS